jgi:hypothetical protein
MIGEGGIMKRLLAVLPFLAVAVAACGEAVTPLEILLVNFDLGSGEAQVWTEMSDAALSEWTAAQWEEFLDLQKQGRLEVAIQLTPSSDWLGGEYGEPANFYDATKLNEKRDGNDPIWHAGDPHGQIAHIDGAFTNLDQWVEHGTCPFDKIIVLVRVRDTAWELRQDYDCQAAVKETRKDPYAQAILFGGPEHIGE